MNKKIPICVVFMFLLSVFQNNSHAQTVIGTFSDTVYLLSVFHYSGEKDNRAENYYCAVFLDEESNIESFIPLDLRKYIRVGDTIEQSIEQEIDSHFVVNTCIGAGMAIITASGQYLNGKDKTAPYYSFITDTVFKSEMVKKHSTKSDILMGKITDPLSLGDLTIGWNCEPRGPWIFDYETKGTYYKLFKIGVDYLLFDDPNMSILGKSYEWTIAPGACRYDGPQNVRLLLGDVGSPFISHLKVIFKDGKILTALPYNVVKFSEE